MVRRDRAPKAPTIYDVARVAEVSHQTVSRYLSGVSPLRPASRERVERAIRELGYRPNLSARLLARGESRTVVALTGELVEVGTVQLVEGVRRAARTAGYLLDVVTYDSSDAGELEQVLGGIVRQDVAGVLAIADTDQLRAAVERQPPGLPLTIAEHAPGSNTVEIQAAIARHLLDLGHRRVTYVAGPRDWRSARTRLRAFEEAAEGLECTRIYARDWSAAAGHEAAAEAGDATAIVCANDQIALGVTRALAERGLRVPEDVSVVGYDDMPESAYFSPPLTTVRQDFILHGAHAFRRVLDRLEPDASREPLPTVEDRLIVRGSTAAVRNSGK
ncbi:LacI family transcriptional regulator [Paractinoplanes deccanensis]|uniref:LacI family transcriptional regulator n=1 Tax=Paractinoplanes deccanensis TaxID=113561 RepID=A0ABQ3YBP5_9ACTN|nr:substrate-binding domain-containing protein [Actinoplanes deccanensis]GID77437.1 LacI family transcriptional regulator [Actinoplanes deccanensis]